MNIKDFMKYLREENERRESAAQEEIERLERNIQTTRNRKSIQENRSANCKCFKQYKKSVGPNEITRKEYEIKVPKNKITNG